MRKFLLTLAALAFASPLFAGYGFTIKPGSGGYYIPTTTAPVTCAAGTEGVTYYDDTANCLEYCDGSSYVCVGSGASLASLTVTTLTATTANVTTLTGANSETITNGTDGQWKFTRNTSGTMTLTCADDDATAALTILPGGAAAMTLGGASMTALTVTTDGTGDGEVVLPTGSVSAGEILDLTRTLSLPIFSFVECTTDAGALIGFTSGADALPNFLCSATDGLGCSLTFDATGGSPDTGRVCGNFVVPADYASGGAFTIRATKGAETGANSEVINCAISNDGAALEAAGTATTSGTAAATYTCTPTIAGLTAGESVSVEFHITSGGTADDAVNFLAVGFTYTATQ